MTAEQHTTKARLQYFEIRIALNRSNKLKNTITELEFEFRENTDEYFIIIKSNKAQNGLRMAVRQKDEELWYIIHSTLYNEFFRYMYKKIFYLTSTDTALINIELTTWLRLLWII